MNACWQVSCDVGCRTRLTDEACYLLELRTSFNNCELFHCSENGFCERVVTTRNAGSAFGLGKGQSDCEDSVLRMAGGAKPLSTQSVSLPCGALGKQHDASGNKHQQHGRGGESVECEPTVSNGLV